MTIANRRFASQGQDDPVTLDQIRAIKETVDFLQSRHRCNLWSQWWDYTTHGDLLGLYRTPPLIMMPNPYQYSAAVYVIVASGHAWSFTINVYHHSNAPIPIILSGTGTGSPQMVQGTGFNPHYSADSGLVSGHITFQGDHAGDLLAVNVNVDFKEEATSPEMYEVADSNHLKNQVQRINALAVCPQITSMWAGTATEQSVGDDAFVISFQDYHRFNDADNVLSLDSQYTTRILTSASAKTNTARSLHYQNTLIENAATDDIEALCEGHTYNSHSISLEGESLAVNSSVKTELHRTTGDNIIYVNAWCNYINSLPQDARLASASGDMADADDVLLLNPEQVCDYDTLSLTGRLLLNNSYYRAGQYNTYIAPKGKSYALTTTFVDLGRVPVYTRDLWYVDTLAKGNVRFTISVAGLNSTGGARNIEIKITDGGTADTYTCLIAASTGSFYAYENCEINTQTTAHYSDWKLEIRDKGGSASVIIYGVTIQHYYDDGA